MPAGLGATVQRALAKQPGERFQTMESVGAVLDDIDVGRSTAELRSPFIRDRRAPSRAALGVAAAVLLSGGVAVWAWQAGWFGEDRPAVTDANLAADLPATADEAYRLGLRLLERYDKDGYVDRSIETFRRALDLRADYAAAHAGLGLAYWRKYREVRDRMWLDYAYTNASRAVELAPELRRDWWPLPTPASSGGTRRGPEVDRRSPRARARSADGLAARAHLRLQQRRAADALASVREARAIRQDDWSLDSWRG